MRYHVRLPALAIIFVLLASACGGSATPSPSASAPPAASAPAESAAASPGESAGGSAAAE